MQDATKLPYTQESFDAVVISNALHIMPQPEKALEEIYRVLRQGGILFAPTICWGEGGYSRLWKLGLKISGFKIYHTWTCEELEQIIVKHGFTVSERAFLPD